MWTKKTLLGLLAVTIAVVGIVSAEDAGASPSAQAETTATTTEGQVVEEEKKEEKPQPSKDSFNAEEHMDWGTYYDPQNVFCGKYDCYKILGFDYESYGSKIKPDRKVITKRYRSLSREWHPDKSKHKDAKERFVKIARAYEVLTNSETRGEYDHMRYNQEAYFQKYGASVLWNYAPKSDATYIIFVLLIVVNLFTWIAQKTRWQQVADRLVRASLEEWSPSMGGTPESKQLREQAQELLKEKEPAVTPATTVTKGKAKKGAKVSGKEKKRLEQEQLRPIIAELVNEMHDFGAGFHKPTWKDLFIVRLAKLPYYVLMGTLWQIKYWARRLQRKELSDEERLVLSERAVGHVTWELASEEDRAAMVKRELWILDKLVEWNEEQEMKNLSRAEQKYIAKMKKRGNKDE